MERTKNALIRDGMPQERIIDVGKKQTDSIEELFDEKDQNQFNIQNKKTNKKIISKNFYDQITNKENKIILSENTVNNFRNLLDIIKTDIESSIDAMEQKIEKTEELWYNIVELLAVKHSIQPNTEEQKMIIKKYAKQIKSIPNISPKRHGEIFNQCLEELGIKIQ